MIILFNSNFTAEHNTHHTTHITQNTEHLNSSALKLVFQMEDSQIERIELKVSAYINASMHLTPLGNEKIKNCTLYKK